MRRLVVACLVVVLAVAGCKGSDTSSSDKTPEARLTAAKKSFDTTKFIGFTLATEQLPDGLQGLLSASGTGTHDPSFTGDVKVQTSVTDISAPLVAVDGSVYAKLPFVGWNTINPADYGAPDPSNLMDTDTGLSSLFTATVAPTAGGSQRSGDQVLTTIDGSLPGDAVRHVFPSAGAADFTVSYALTSDDRVASAKISGPFYDGSADVTYTVDFDLQASPVDIQAPV